MVSKVINELNGEIFVNYEVEKVLKDVILKGKIDILSITSEVKTVYEIKAEKERDCHHVQLWLCGVCRNTLSKYWRKGLGKGVFFPPQIRLKMYAERKEYIYLVQSDSANKLYYYYQKHPNAVYIAYTSGNFDLLVQTSAPLEVLPDRTLFCGSRSDYVYPETPHCSFEKALKRMEKLIEKDHEKSKIKVVYTEEGEEKGSSYYGWKIFPYVKRDLKIEFTPIAKKLHIASVSFMKGLEYLLNVSTKLLPFYPKRLPIYSQYFFVFWSDYEEFLCEFFGCLPCHVSITKVENALFVYASVLKGIGLSERLFQLCFRLKDLGFVERFWSSIPVYYWIPDVP